MTSVVIAARNEAAVIGRCLDALLATPDAPLATPDAPQPPHTGPGDAALDITVVANGCTDATAAVARARPGVRVLELAEGSKPAALNAGDAAAVGWPRVYLDADMALSGADIRRLAAAVADGPALAAVPRRRLALAGRPLPVRAYYAVHTRLPVFATALFGRGAIALSEAGRARFDRFPDVIADDLFLDCLFRRGEKREVPEVTAWVAAPWRTRDLVRRLSRVRAGNAALRTAAPALRATPAPDTGTPAPDAATPAWHAATPAWHAAAPGVPPPRRTSWLRDVVMPRPWLAPAAACYVALTLAAEILARREASAGDRSSSTWGRDESSRALR